MCAPFCVRLLLIAASACVHVCCLGVAAVRQVNLNLMLCMAISGVALPLGSRCFGCRCVVAVVVACPLKILCMYQD